MYSNDFHEFPQILLRLGAAMLLGGAIGANRDLHHKPAGLRVLALVSVGSALVTMLMLNASGRQPTMTYDGLSRVIQGILQGIGFLGAGVIMHTQSRYQVHGMTTAASIWVTSALGVACGMGLWAHTLAAFFVSVIVLTLGRYIEKTILRLSPLPKDEQTHGPPEHSL